MTIRQPIYLIAGGRSANRDTTSYLLKQVLRESPVPKPDIAYVGSANGDSEGFFGGIAAQFKEFGSGRVDRVLTSAPDANLTEAKRMLKQADLIFMSGGDVEAGMSTLERCRLTRLIKDLYDQGKVLFGISAGTIMLAKEWIRWRDPDDDATAETFPCLNIAPVLCDTHGEQDGWGELKALLGLKETGTIGYGIVSGAALKVRPDGAVEALGGPVDRYKRTKVGVRKISALEPQSSALNR